VRGALSEKGAADLKADVALQSSWGTGNITSIASLGDEATYGVDSSTNFAAVAALSGKHAVVLGAIDDPIPPSEALVPLARKALTGITLP
jgi:hypothetical protein